MEYRARGSPGIKGFGKAAPVQQEPSGQKHALRAGAVVCDAEVFESLVAW